VIVLASRSPQRRALLTSLGIEFRVVASRVDEGAEPVRNARDKAEDVAGRAGIPAGGAVLGCDTEVLRDGAALGKPGDAAAARDMLRSLAGREHEVQSAIALITESGVQERLSITRVRMRTLPPEALDWYLSTGDWRERAGGYAIQGAGAALVEGIDGDYTGVVGLPLAALVDALNAAGLAPWSPGGVQYSGG
jgi:septum formation protein